MEDKHLELQKDGIRDDIKQIKAMIKLKTDAMNHTQAAWAGEINTLEQYLAEAITTLKALGGTYEL